MMDQTFVALPLRRYAASRNSFQLFGRFLLSQPRVLPRFLRPGLETLLVLQVLAIGLQFARESPTIRSSAS